MRTAAPRLGLALVGMLAMLSWPATPARSALPHYGVVMIFAGLGPSPASLAMVKAAAELRRALKMTPGTLPIKVYYYGNLYPRLIARERLQVSTEADLPAVAFCPLDRYELPGPPVRIMRRTRGAEELAQNIQAAAAGLQPTEPDAPGELLHVAREVSQERRFKNAAEFFQLARPKQPDRALMWLWMGDNLDALRQSEDALHAYDVCLKIDPSFAMAWFNKASILRRDGHLDEAYEAAVRATEADERLLLAWYLRGVLGGETDHADDALASYQRVLQIDMGIPEVYLGRGVLYGNRGDLDAAEGSFRTARLLDPNNALACFQEASCLIQRGQCKDAVPLLQKATSLNDRLAPAWYYLGQAYYGINDLQQARRALLRAFALEPRLKEELSFEERQKLNLLDRSPAPR